MPLSFKWVIVACCQLPNLLSLTWKLRPAAGFVAKYQLRQLMSSPGAKRRHVWIHYRFKAHDFCSPDLDSYFPSHFSLLGWLLVLMFKSLKLGFQCELPSQEWESVARASLQIQSDFSSFSKNTNEKLTIVRIWQMLQYYKITKCKTFLQSSWLAKEVGKPTRCAASCQIARGELSLMHLYNTCIIHIIMTHAIYVQIWHICYIYILLSH